MKFFVEIWRDIMEGYEAARSVRRGNLVLE